MKYSLFNPPFSKPFSEMDRIESRVYFKWLLEQIPIRISLLEQTVVVTDDKYSLWKADNNPNSLLLLGQWLKEKSQLRTRSQSEIQSIYENLSPQQKSMGISLVTLDEMSYSIAIDVGLYLGETLRINLQKVNWQLLTKPKSHIYFQQVILNGFKKGYVCNPIAISIGLTYDLAWKKVEAHDLLVKFMSWTNLLESQ